MLYHLTGKSASVQYIFEQFVVRGYFFKSLRHCGFGYDAFIIQTCNVVVHELERIFALQKTVIGNQRNGVGLKAAVPPSAYIVIYIRRGVLNKHAQRFCRLFGASEQ